MSLVEIASRLERSIGLDPAIVGVDSIDHAVRRRMAALSLSEIEAYSTMLAGSDREMQELVEGVIVPETWFYRDREPFAFLARHAVTEWLPVCNGRTFRVLSAPCSTGEEAYSIAMALLDAGFAEDQFQIDAVDISDAVLAKAAQAVYGQNSFRGDDLGFREKYFDRKGESFRLCDEVSRTVRFSRGNLLDELFLHGTEPYHAVFCRNLLIYLARSARTRVLSALDRLLDRPGLLFVGHAETLQVTSRNFIDAGQPRAFAFRTSEPLESWNALARSTTVHSYLRTSSPESSTGAQVRSTRRIDGVESHPTAELEAALREADGGNLSGAEKLCERIIAERGPSAQAYFILGLIREASGLMDAAEKDFQKTVYLEPCHYQALIHLALLTRRRNTDAAAYLEQRARRVNLLNSI